MDKIKVTIEIPVGDYCMECPCLGLNGNEEEHCGYFNKSLDWESDEEGLVDIRVIKCGECKLMTKMLLNEAK